MITKQVLNPASNLVRALLEQAQHGLNLSITHTAKRIIAPNQTDVGQLIIQSNPSEYRLVYINLVSEQPVAMDSHMLYVFAPKNELYPHFTVDAVQVFAPGQKDPVYGFHVDLVPHIGLGQDQEHQGYYQATYRHIAPLFKSVYQLEGSKKADLGDAQIALMSPYMVARRAGSEAFKTLSRLAISYFDVWIELVLKGYEAQEFKPISEMALLQYDFKTRQKMFSAKVDPVWDQILPLIGTQNRDDLMKALIDPEPVQPVPFALR